MFDNVGVVRPSGQYRQTIAGIELVATTPVRAPVEVCEMAVTPPKGGGHVHLVNAYTVSLVEKRTELGSVLNNGAINYPDGKPLTWLSRMKHHSPRLNQVRGPQLFLNVINEGQRHSLKHYLLGGTPEVLSKLVATLDESFPDALIVGSESPPFRPLTKEEQALQDDRIRDSGADIVWVGLGTPKQDFEAERVAHQTSTIAVAVGAAFDFAAGTAREAPHWISRIGMEWFFRLCSEPRRLWKRYTIGNLVFLSRVARTWRER